MLAYVKISENVDFPVMDNRPHEAQTPERRRREGRPWGWVRDGSPLPEGGSCVTREIF